MPWKSCTQQRRSNRRCGRFCTSRSNGMGWGQTGPCYFSPPPPPLPHSPPKCTRARMRLMSTSAASSTPSAEARTPLAGRLNRGGLSADSGAAAARDGNAPARSGAGVGAGSSGSHAQLPHAAPSRPLRPKGAPMGADSATAALRTGAPLLSGAASAHPHAAPPADKGPCAAATGAGGGASACTPPTAPPPAAPCRSAPASPSAALRRSAPTRTCMWRRRTSSTAARAGAPSAE